MSTRPDARVPAAPGGTRRTSPGRRSLAVLGATAVLVAAGALPASAAVPDGWPVPPSIDPMHTILVLAAIPLALFVIIIVLTYAPAIARGEDVRPGAGQSNLWLGGPRKGTAALPAAETHTTVASSRELTSGQENGGASGRW